MPTHTGDKKDHKEKGSTKNKLSETFKSFKKNENIENIMSYAKNHTLDSVGFILLALGIIWLFFNPFYGGILVGLVAGYYFSHDVLQIINSFDRFLNKQGIARNLVLAGTLLALFILAPGVFIGAGIVIGIKYLLKAQS